MRIFLRDRTTCRWSWRYCSVRLFLTIDTLYENSWLRSVSRWYCFAKRVNKVRRKSKFISTVDWNSLISSNIRRAYADSSYFIMSRELKSTLTYDLCIYRNSRQIIINTYLVLRWWTVKRDILLLSFDLALSCIYLSSHHRWILRCSSCSTHTS